MEDAEISEIAKLLWEAPYAVLSHDLQEEPVKYGQKLRLDARLLMQADSPDWNFSIHFFKA